MQIKYFSYWQFAVKLTPLVVSLCIVADVKFQKNNYYGHPDNSESTHPFNNVQ